MGCGIFARERWRKKITERKTIPVVRRIKKKNKRIPPPSGLERIMNRKNRIGAEQWADIVYGALSEYGAGKSRKKIISEIEPLYLDRAASFIRTTKKMNIKETNRAIEKQAEIFFKKRDQAV